MDAVTTCTAEDRTDVVLANMDTATFPEVEVAVTVVRITDEVEDEVAIA